MMDYTRIGKIEKAKRYAAEPERIQFLSFTVDIRGDNGTHTIHYKDGHFQSDGPFFMSHGFSAHTIALEKLLGVMVTSPAQNDDPVTVDSAYISKIEKAKRYAAERERFTFTTFEVSIRGDNGTHTVRYQDGHFESEEEYFKKHGYSAHTMTMERVLEGMIPSPATLEDS